MGLGAVASPGLPPLPYRDTPSSRTSASCQLSSVCRRSCESHPGWGWGWRREAGALGPSVGTEPEDCDLEPVTPLQHHDGPPGEAGGAGEDVRRDRGHRVSGAGPGAQAAHGRPAAAAHLRGVARPVSRRGPEQCPSLRPAPSQDALRALTSLSRRVYGHSFSRCDRDAEGQR